MKFPFTLLSDPDQKVARTYGSTMTGRPYDARTVYVIGRDGTSAPPVKVLLVDDHELVRTGLRTMLAGGGG